MCGVFPNILNPNTQKYTTYVCGGVIAMQYVMGLPYTRRGYIYSELGRGYERSD